MSSAIPTNNKLPEYTSTQPPTYSPRSSTSSSSIQESDIDPPKKASEQQVSTCCADCWGNCCFGSCAGQSCTRSDKDFCGTLLAVMCCGSAIAYGAGP
ncbi:hypothetical protein SBY92_000121 [Candida maltosa Xu316]|uniref:Uncharacterized protein n=1 Tax=Candida maltosa (strain Xu316) TaxID=1245528 RepID=M3JXT0_CANMX|nr:hypothetical protein G210_2468 [Candida maltosa Xu316]